MSSTSKSRSLKLDKDNSSIFVIIAAAGRGERFGSGLPKQFQLINGIFPVRRSVELFLELPYINGVICTIPSGFQETYNQIFKNVLDKRLLPPIVGGGTRSESVRNGLNAIKQYSPEYVLIQDAVRCFCSKEIVENVISSLLDGAKAVIPTITPVDSVRLDGHSVNRSNIKLVQTPQGFHFETIYTLHEKYSNIVASDDASLCDRDGIKIDMVEGDTLNKKITYITDIETHVLKTGFGYDAHRFSNDKNRRLFINGKLIENYRGLDGNSDADVGIHSLFDAILGALGEGSIGEHFEPNDKKWLNADSKIFLEYCRKLLNNKNARIVNIDSTIVCEEPNIAKHASDMKRIIANSLGIHETMINIKGKTTEGMGFEGRKEGISAYSIVTIISI